jgi:hypothetical protein
MRPLAPCSVAAALAIVALSLARCASPPPVPEGSDLAGSDSCATCHEEEARLRLYGAHRTVECERCHGPGAKHARADGGGMSLGDADLCLSCHKKGADPSANVVSAIESFEDHLTDLERDHRIKLDRRKSGTDCVYCHDPHLLE